MQTQLIAPLRPADQAPPSRDDHPASTAFSSVLGSLFAAFPAGQAPEVAREAGPQDRPAAGRDVADAVRPDGTDARRRDVPRNAEADPVPAVRQKLEARSPEDRPTPGSTPAPKDALASQAGTAVRAAGDRSVTPSAFGPSPSPVSVAVPAPPAGGSEAASPGLSAVAVPQGPETAPVAEIAPPSDVPATAGNAAAQPFPAPTVPVATPVVSAGDSGVSAATQAAADRVPAAVAAPGPQAGPAAQALRTAQPSGSLAPSSVERVAAAVKSQASLGGGRVKILLHPPHLGALRIEVAVRDGIVFARMETESNAARHQLQQHSNDLRQSLEDQGLSLGRMSVSVSQGDGNGNQAAFAPGPGSFFGEPEPELESDPLPGARPSRLLDVTA